MDEFSPILFFGLVAIGIALTILGQLAEKKRRQAIELVAERLGLTFDSARSHSVSSSLSCLNKLNKGSNRYAFNTLRGTLESHAILAFDYHYETYSRNSKGHRRTHHHYLSCYCVTLDRNFPELNISKEHFFSKVAQALGWDDIDFESHEFSKSYCVRSKDKKFAYDFCSARMIDYLLDHKGLNIEVENSILAVIHRGKMDPETIEARLRQVTQIRHLMPDYLFT